ncbi:MAG: molybdopterin-dependent oxidoreductase [Acidimicrobiaceae bacterium]|nr:molybdopterin-dependent oxidoreductase [Acidimicrobiaceae bacterium]MBT5580534.1 molybdopterin-dependent oxidoreductase [Acidimicrobiaceae bacterium]
MSEPMIVRGSCHHDCPDTCVWDVTVSDGRAVKLRGNVEHPTTKGVLCPKVNHFLDRVYHPARLLTPLRRVGPKGEARFEPVSWDEALAEISLRFSTLSEEVGGESILQFSFDGTQGVIQKGIMADRFFNAIGASDIHRHLCGTTAWLGASDVSGQPFGFDPEDLVKARTIILWGTNTYLTNRHLWPVIEQARADGALVIVIDPVRTSTAERADEFLQLQPGTDTALVLAMIQVLDRDGLIDRDWIQANTSGWDELLASARAMSLDRAEQITGLSAERISWLADTYVSRRPAAIRMLVGPEHRQHGRDIMRAVAMLPAVTGAWRDSGGGLARSTQVYFETALNYPAPPDPPRRTFNMARLGEILTDRELAPAVAALVVHNSNPAVIVPEQNRIIEGLEREDLFTVVIEQFMTDTARYADIVLPTTTQIEHLDLGIAWGHLNLALNQPAIEPVGDTRPNTEIFRGLAAVMGFHDPALQADDEMLIRELLDSDHEWLEGITYDRLVQETWVRLNVAPGTRPYVDTGPQTDDGRLQLGALEFRAGDETPEGASDLAARFPLVLMTRKQHVKFLNANYAQFGEHLPQEGEPLLQIHPEDAKARGLRAGDRVDVFNDRGRLTLGIEFTDEVLPGVVAVPFGWHHRHTPQGRAVNALTNPAVPADGHGSAAYHETLVEVVLEG